MHLSAYGFISLWNLLSQLIVYKCNSLIGVEISSPRCDTRRPTLCLFYDELVLWWERLSLVDMHASVVASCELSLRLRQFYTCKHDILQPHSDASIWLVFVSSWCRKAKDRPAYGRKKRNRTVLERALSPVFTTRPLRSFPWLFCALFATGSIHLRQDISTLLLLGVTSTFEILNWLSFSLLFHWWVGSALAFLIFNEARSRWRWYDSKFSTLTASTNMCCRTNMASRSRNQ